MNLVSFDAAGTTASYYPLHSNTLVYGVQYMINFMDSGGGGGDGSCPGPSVPDFPTGTVLSYDK